MNARLALMKAGTQGATFDDCKACMIRDSANTNMTSIALGGGSSLSELGPREDVEFFFHCLNRLAARTQPADKFELLTDRLYRRFLRLEELQPAAELMQQVRVEFDRISTSSVDWRDAPVDPSTSRLALAKPTLAGVFSKYFELFDHCVKSAQLNFEEFRGYPGYRFEPVRIVIADQPWLLVDKKRALEDYEALQGLPFWMQVS